ASPTGTGLSRRRGQQSVKEPLQHASPRRGGKHIVNHARSTLRRLSEPVFMRWLQLLFVLLLVPLAACATNGKVSTYPVETAGAYAVGSGDVLRVKVFGDDTASGSYKVDEAGMIAMPLVGQVRASGRTTAE